MVGRRHIYRGFFVNFAMLEDGGKSMVVEGANFQADARWLEIGIFVVFVAVLAWAVSGLFSLAVEVVLEGSGRARKYRAAIDMRATLISRFKKRRGVLLSVVDQRNDEVNAIQGQRAALIKRLNKLRSAKDQLVRQIGENTTGSHRYNFVVANRYVLSYVAKGQQHPLLDESWKHGQLVEVWAKSLMDARITVVDRYPATLGYFVEKLEGKSKNGEEEDGESNKGKAKA